MRFLQCTQVAEGPGHLIPVSLDIPLVPASCAKHIGYLLRHTGLFGYADNHLWFVFELRRYGKLSGVPNYLQTFFRSSHRRAMLSLGLRWTYPWVKVALTLS